MSRKVINAINEKVKALNSVGQAKGTLKGYIKMYLMATWPHVESMKDKDFDILVSSVADEFYNSSHYKSLLDGLEETVQKVKKDKNI